MPNNETVRVVIATAITVERQAVLAHLGNIYCDYAEKESYRRGIFLTEKILFDVLVLQTGRGNISAALKTFRAVQHFRPTLLFFVGIAGGIKDVNIGDLVISEKVYGYEYGKVGINSFQTRPEISSPSGFFLRQVAQVEAEEQSWLERIKGKTLNAVPNVLLAPIASGESVIASTKSPLYERIRNSYSDAVSVDMESFGFCQASRCCPEIDSLVVRGISDLIDDKGCESEDYAQRLAASHASAFAFHLLAKVDVDNLHQKKSEIETKNNFSINHSDMQVHVHREDFLQLMRFIISKIQYLCNEFKESQENFYDISKSVLKLMEYLEINVNEHYQGKKSNRNTNFILNNLQKKMTDIISLLNMLKDIYLSGKPESDLLPLRKQICSKLTLLMEQLRRLETLEEFKEEKAGTSFGSRKASRRKELTVRK